MRALGYVIIGVEFGVAFADFVLRHGVKSWGPGGDAIMFGTATILVIIMDLM